MLSKWLFKLIIKIYFTITHTMNEFVLKKLNKNNCSSSIFISKKFKELENNIWKIDDLKNLISKRVVLVNYVLKKINCRVLYRKPSF